MDRMWLTLLGQYDLLQHGDHRQTRNYKGTSDVPGDVRFLATSILRCLAPTKKESTPHVCVIRIKFTSKLLLNNYETCKFTKNICYFSRAALQRQRRLHALHWGRAVWPEEAHNWKRAHAGKHADIDDDSVPGDAQPVARPRTTVQYCTDSSALIGYSVLTGPDRHLLAKIFSAWYVSTNYLFFLVKFKCAYYYPSVITSYVLSAKIKYINNYLQLCV